jgi:hypothetical protein
MGMKSADDLRTGGFTFDLYTGISDISYPGYFCATGKLSYTIDDIITRYSPRVPDPTSSQKSFKALVAILSDESGTDYTSNIIDDAKWFAGPQSDTTTYPNFPNFSRGTRGIGSFVIGNVKDSLLSAGLTFENDSVGDTSNGAYDSAEQKIVLYYKSGYLEKVSAGIKITNTSPDPVTISFAGTNSEIGVSLASDAANNDIKSTGIANIPAGSSETIRIEIDTDDIDNTIAGVKRVKINGAGIALIGQPVPTPGPQVDGSGDFIYRETQAQRYLTLMPSYLFLENPKMYKFDWDTGSYSGSALDAGDYVIGNGPGGIRVTNIYDPVDHASLFESDGAVDVDPNNTLNNQALLRLTADKLRANSADGPLIAGYNYSPVSLYSFIFFRLHVTRSSKDRITTTVGTTVSDVFPLETDPTFNPETTVIKPLLYKIIRYENGGSIVEEVPELMTEFNGLTLELNNKSIIVTGTAKDAGTANYLVHLGVENVDPPSYPLPVDRVYGQAVFFTIAISENSSTPPPAPEIKPGPAPGPGVITPPEQETVDEAKAEIIADIGIDEEKIIAAETARINKNQNVFAEEDGVRVYTAAAISVNQPVSEGGAAIVGEIFLPLTGKSLSERELPVPEVFTELAKLYSVNKYFQGKDAREGGTLDLLKIYGADLFSYSKEDGGVHLNATVVIVDGPAPKGDSGVTSPYNNPEYGVKLAKHDEGENYLYVFDGVTDGSANDPIALVANELNDDETDITDESDNTNDDTIVTPNTRSSGGGSCNGGFLALTICLAASIQIKASRRESR